MLAKPDKEGGIVHALQLQKVPEIISHVKEPRMVFASVKDGAPILSDEHPVILELLKGPFPCLDAWHVDTL